MRRAPYIWLLAFALIGCGGEPAPDASLPEGAVPLGERCVVRLTYRDLSSTPRVFVAGSWNDFSPSAQELQRDSEGGYSIDLELRPGLYPYKFYVEGDGGEPWRLDPGNPYRAYAGGEENSGLRVPECARPRLRVERVEVLNTEAGAGGARATLRVVSPGARASAIRGEIRANGEWRALTHTEAQFAEGEALVEVAGLTAGKYTLRFTPEGVSGADGESLLIPFWVEPRPFVWEDALIYLVFTDRFRNGDPANDPAATDASRGADFMGGDLVGVTRAIEEGYFESLGVNALWLTPFNQNPAGTYLAADGVNQVTGYHGYWPTDPLAVDARLGGSEALEALVQAAHRRGIRVLMDLVVNHVHEDHPYVREHPGWFSEGCVCGTEGCDWTGRRLDCLFRPYMPDVDWTNPEAAERMVEDSLTWMEAYDLDGFRVDAVKHVQDAAVYNLRARVRERFETGGVRHFLMGETAMGWDDSAGPAEGGNVENYETISRYVGEDALDGQFDFVLYYAAALQFLRDEPGRGMAHIDYWTRASAQQYPAGSIMTPYLGSHDTPRFMTLAADPGRAGNKWDDLPTAPSGRESYDRMYVALAWLFSLPGAPLLYYGDEYGEFGASDPDNRHRMRFGDELSSHEATQLARVQRLGRARQQNAGLRARPSDTLLADETTSVVLRGQGEERVLVVVHRGGEARAMSLSIASEVWPEGTVLQDTLSSESVTVRGGAIDLELDAFSALYLARRD